MLVFLIHDHRIPYPSIQSQALVEGVHLPDDDEFWKR